MQIAVVVNPTSGKRRGEQIAHEVVQTLRGFGHQRVTWAADGIVVYGDGERLTTSAGTP